MWEVDKRTDKHMNVDCVFCKVGKREKMRNYNNHNIKRCSSASIYGAQARCNFESSSLWYTRFPTRAATCGGRDPSGRKNTVGEICVYGKWGTFLMSRRKFRSGNNKRKETCLSEVGRKKINTNKPVLRFIRAKIITILVSGAETSRILRTGWEPINACI
jgi:hypothetical protein